MFYKIFVKTVSKNCGLRKFLYNNHWLQTGSPVHVTYIRDTYITTQNVKNIL